MSSELLKVVDISSRKGKFKLNNISFVIEPGFIYGLMGENGAGKTTLMKYIADDKCKYDGEIYFEGELLHKNHAEIMNKIGYVSEDKILFNMLSGKENASIFGGLYDNFDMEKFEETAKLLNVSVNKKYEAMSRGEKIKIQLAFEMAHSPKLFILDEITAGMDPVFKKDLFSALHKLIENEDTSILMTSHIESEMKKHVDYVAVMKQGSLGAFQPSIDM